MPWAEMWVTLCIMGSTQWSFLEEPSYLSVMPPWLFVLERHGHMKSSLFLLKATVAHRRIKSSEWGMVYERIAITSFQTLSWEKKPQGQKFTSKYSLLAKNSPDLTHRDYHIMWFVSAKPRNNATPLWLLPTVRQADLSPLFEWRNHRA